MKLDTAVEEEIDIEEIPEAVKQKIIDADNKEQEAKKMQKKKEETVSEPLLDPWIFEEAREKVEITPALEMPKQKEPQQLLEEDEKQQADKPTGFDLIDLQ